LQALLDEVRGTPESFAVHLAVLRSMKQAEYSPELVGHFALASEHYCHFTSPIRRYPDLTVHRLLERYLRGEGQEYATTGSAGAVRFSGKHRGQDPGTDSASRSDRKKVKRRVASVSSAGHGSAPDLLDERQLAKLGARCSANERRAEAAERELNLVLTLRLLEKSLGDEVDGIVTGVANTGVYVQLEKYLIDGLLRFENLPDDWWRVDPSRGAVVGERSGRRITVGDRLKVILSRIHLPTRQLELALAQPPPAWKSARDAKPPSHKHQPLTRSAKEPPMRKPTNERRQRQQALSHPGMGYGKRRGLPRRRRR
jgi:ribonuclease R